jgi:antitoxin component YwqK of YwqJK toxin-antitoxin module
VYAPKEITREWETKVFGIKSEVAELDTAVHEMVDGLIDDAFEATFFERMKAEIKNNPKGEGMYTECWPNGALKCKLPYKDRKADGHLHGWYDNGLDAFKGYFKEGVKQGFHITFYRIEPSGHVNEARLLAYNEKGQLDGESIRNHKTGGLWIAAEYENGKFNGALEGWDLNRKYFLSANYKKGFLQKKPPLPPGKRKMPKSTMASTYVHQVTKSFLKIAKKEFGATCCGSGSGMPFDVEFITVFLSIKRKGTVEEGRELFVKLTDRFVEVVNQHEKLRPYLREYPFTPLRAEVIIDFCNERGETNTDGGVARIMLSSKKILCYRTIKSKGAQPEDLFVEPYEEALKIVKSKEQKR